jgi:outer membrane murein-binding lipoprotein Lpp
MERALWMAIGMALVMLAGCEKRMSYDQLDVTRANALNALALAHALESRVEDLEGRLDDLESQ